MAKKDMAQPVIDDMFAPAALLVPDKTSILDLLASRTNAYFGNPDLLDPFMGKSVKFKKKHYEKTLSPPQQSVRDYGGRFAIETEAAGERVFYYVTVGVPPSQEELRLAYFMAEKCFRIVEAK